MYSRKISKITFFTYMKLHFKFAVYPIFKNVKQAFKKNEIFKFRIVTNSESVPIGSELYNAPKAE